MGNANRQAGNGDLWHFTCPHRAPLIRGDGYIRPALDLMPELARLTPDRWWAIAWFTDLDTPVRDALGLTSLSLNCDRTTHRFRVLNAADIIPWLKAPGRHSEWGRNLERATGARPMHWFVSTEPVPVIEAPRNAE